jgi:hypothetical protein
MEKTGRKMICPHCGMEMNHHGDKLVYTTGAREAAANDTVLGGFLEEFYACPGCSAGASRRA